MGFLSFMDLLIPDFHLVSIPSSKGFLFVRLIIIELYELMTHLSYRIYHRRKHRKRDNGRYISLRTGQKQNHAHILVFFDMMLL